MMNSDIRFEPDSRGYKRVLEEINFTRSKAINVSQWANGDYFNDQKGDDILLIWFKRRDFLQPSVEDSMTAADFTSSFIRAETMSSTEIRDFIEHILEKGRIWKQKFRLPLMRQPLAVIRRSHLAGN